MEIEQCPEVEEAWKEIMEHKARKAEKKKIGIGKLNVK